MVSVIKKRKLIVLIAFGLIMLVLGLICDILIKLEIMKDYLRQPIKFCVNNNPSSNNGKADCGAIRLSDLPRANSSFLSAEYYACRA